MNTFPILDFELILKIIGQQLSILQRSHNNTDSHSEGIFEKLEWFVMHPLIFKEQSNLLIDNAYDIISYIFNITAPQHFPNLGIYTFLIHIQVSSLDNCLRERVCVCLCVLSDTNISVVKRFDCREIEGFGDKSVVESTTSHSHCSLHSEFLSEECGPTKGI
jgi:hypothetical protein